MSTSLRDMIDAYRVSQVVCVAAELGIPDLLEKTPQSAENLAAATQVDAGAMARLLRALQSLGIVERAAHGCFALTATGERLCTNAGNSLRPWALLSARLYRGWEDLLTAVRIGAAGGAQRWQALEEAPEESRRFNEAMRANSVLVAKGLLQAYDFSSFRTIADVGGGSGAMLETLLTAYPAARGVLVDLPGAIRDARERLAASGLLGRCELCEASFFDALPRGADLYLLSRVLHDWGDERAAAILRRTREAMALGKPLLIIERVMDPVLPAKECALSDLSMLVMNGGRERSAAEFAALLGTSGFALKGIAQTSTPFAVLEAVAV